MVESTDKLRKKNPCAKCGCKLIEFKCKTHNIKKMSLKEYFERESRYLYYNTMKSYSYTIEIL